MLLRGSRIKWSQLLRNESFLFFHRYYFSEQKWNDHITLVIVSAQDFHYPFHETYGARYQNKYL